MHYTHAPITEALIDIRVELPSDVNLDRLTELTRRINVDYPREESRAIASAQVTFEPEIKTEAQRKQLGFARYSKDDREVVQFRLDGFTFSRLEPYQTWEHLKERAKQLWDIFRDGVKPLKITRVAVRYINQFNFPGPSIEPEDYLNIFPQIAKTLPSSLRDMGPFSMTLVIPQVDLSGTLIINEAITNPKLENTIPIILDLDLFVPNPAIKDEVALWSLFDRLRTRKNEYFENFITDRTRELIK